MVHPNQEPAVIAGQGTIALEVLEQVRGCSTREQSCHRNGSRFFSAQAPEVNAVVVPVGGGGMVAGIAVAIKVSNSTA